MHTRTYHVYILTNPTKTVLYIGYTGNIEKRLITHYLRCKYRISNCFTARYNCWQLIYLEDFETARAAIQRERQLKKWSRKKKEVLIARINPKEQVLNDRITSWPPDDEHLKWVLRFTN